MTTRTPFPRDPAGPVLPRGSSLKRRHLTTALAVLTGATVLFFGLNFLLNPDGAPSGFGITPWPEGNADGYFAVKGVRDIVVGATVFLLLMIGQRRTLGWVVRLDAIIPLGDALVVVTHGGTYTAALSVHVSAAAFVVLTGVMLLTENGRRPLERAHLTPSA